MTAQSGPVAGEVPQEAATRFIGEARDLEVEDWVAGLRAPWSLVFLPDGRALVSERPGRIRLIRGGSLPDEPYLQLDVAAVGEGGLMGLAVHPGSPIWSWGHRNPQGLAWHPETGDLFSSEHGPSGEYGLRGRDIVTVIVRGGNYGWPREAPAEHRRATASNPSRDSSPGAATGDATEGSAMQWPVPTGPSTSSPATGTEGEIPAEATTKF